MTAPTAVARDVYHVGDEARLFGSFTNLAGAAADPTTAVCTVRKPDGTIATPAVVHDGLGAYHADVLLPLGGTYYYGWVGTGAVIAGNESELYVIPTKLTA
jgi:hypothetical protein